MLKYLLLAYLMIMLGVGWVRALDNGFKLIGARDKGFSPKVQREFLYRSIGWASLFVSSAGLFLWTLTLDVS
mgnify:CR=1 FL=1